MTRLLRNLLLATLIFACTLSLLSCGKGIQMDEAKALLNDFLATIEAEDYEAAQALLHPDRPADLEDFLLGVEQEQGLDFQTGIEIERYTHFASSLYDSTVGGSRYELTARTKVGESTIFFTVEIVKNDNGYGIYNFNLST